MAKETAKIDYKVYRIGQKRLVSWIEESKLKKFKSILSVVGLTQKGFIENKIDELITENKELLPKEIK